MYRKNGLISIICEKNHDLNHCETSTRIPTVVLNYFIQLNLPFVTNYESNVIQKLVETQLCRPISSS